MTSQANQLIRNRVAQRSLSSYGDPASCDRIDDASSIGSASESCEWIDPSGVVKGRRTSLETGEKRG